MTSKNIEKKRYLQRPILVLFVIISVVSFKDPAMIDAYIRAFRNVIIEEEITDKDKMYYVADGVIDYIFIVDDDTKITIGTDLTEYITDRNRGIQFHLGNTEQFNDLNKKLRQ